MSKISQERTKGIWKVFFNNFKVNDRVTFIGDSGKECKGFVSRTVPFRKGRGMIVIETREGRFGIWIRHYFLFTFKEIKERKLRLDLDG